jgi:hypothetical protein
MMRQMLDIPQNNCYGLKSMGNDFGFVFLGEVVSRHSILLFGFHIKEMKPGFILSQSLKTFVALYSIPFQLLR